MPAATSSSSSRAEPVSSPPVDLAVLIPVKDEAENVGPLVAEVAAALGPTGLRFEVIFVDDDGSVSARRWSWRQSAQSAASESTSQALITVEGHHDGAEVDVAAALDDLLGLLAIHQPESSSAFDLLAPGHHEFIPT